MTEEKPELVVATSNPGKVREVKELLSHRFNVDGILDREDLAPVPETGDTFRENADLKARGYFEQIGKPTIADDSGLCVEALDGAPGVRSARFAGTTADDEDNNRKLLRELEGVPEKKRDAYFECWIVLYISEQIQVMSAGRCEGRITEEPRGSGGFGYDPLFLPDGHNRTFAEMEPQEKNQISHRSRALKRLQSFLDRKDLNL